MKKNNKRKTVLIVTSTGRLGGGAIALYDILKELKKFNYNIIIWFPHKGNALDKLKPFANKIIVSKISYLYAFHHISIKFDFVSVKRLLKAILFFPITAFVFYSNTLKDKVDVVYLNSSVLFSVALLAKLRNMKVVTQIRELPYLNLFGKIYFNSLLKYSNYVLCSSKTIYDSLEQLRNNVFLAEDWVDISKFNKKSINSCRKKLYFNNNYKYVGMANGLNTEKGLFVFLNAILKIRDKMPFSRFNNMRFLFIGEFQNYNIKQEFEEFIKKNSLANFIIYPGWVENIHDYICAMDIVISPNIAAEGFGKTIIEAQACGKCIIASNIGPSVELIKNNETGILFETGNVADLANKIIYILKNENKRKVIENKAYNFAIFNYSKNVLLKDTIKYITDE